MASRETLRVLSRSPGIAQYVAATTAGLHATTPPPSSTNNIHTIPSVTVPLELDFCETTTNPCFSYTRFNHLRAEKDPSNSPQGHGQTNSSPTSTTSEAPSPVTPSILPPTPAAIPSTTITSDTTITSIVTGANDIAPGQTSSLTTIVTPFTYTTAVIASGSSSRSVSLDGTPITSHQPVPGTNSGSVYPTATSVTSSSESSRLPMILGLALGIPFLVALGVILYVCCTRRRRASRQAQSNLRWLQRVTTPPIVTPALLGGQIPTSPRASRKIGRLSSRGHSKADNLSQIIEVQTSGSSASTRDSLQTTELTNSPSVGTALTSVYFFSSSGVGSERLNSPRTHNTTSSSELNFFPPVPSDATSTYSPHLSPSGHYRGRSLAGDGGNVVYFRLAESDLPVVGTQIRALLDEARMN